VNHNLAAYAPFFDGCIGALDGTQIKVSMNRQAKADYINRKGDVTINVCAIIDMDMRFTFVGAGGAGSVHDIGPKRLLGGTKLPASTTQLVITSMQLMDQLCSCLGTKLKLIVEMVLVLQDTTI
jgi:hypothetical protein